MGWADRDRVVGCVGTWVSLVLTVLMLPVLALGGLYLFCSICVDIVRDMVSQRRVGC
jgi:hypothetical protein